MISIDQLVEGKIDAIAFGGEGILRYRGIVIFIPFTAIGDQIICRITEVKRSFAKGVLVELRYASKHRTQPLCPYFGTCGGCQLQHIDKEAQLKYKRTAVTDALKRIGHLDIPEFSIIPAIANWSYRRHITLHLRPKEEGFEAGYIGQDNRSLIAVRTCPIFNELGHPILDHLQQLLRKLPNHSKEGRLTVLKNHRNQFILYFLFDQPWEADIRFLQTALQQSPELAGIIIKTPEKQVILGDPYCEEKFEGLTLRFSPQTFIQNHPEQSVNIYRHIRELASHTAQHPILDLYCGFGVTSLLLAQQGFPVTGIEWNAEAIRHAIENASMNHLKNIHFIQGDVEKALSSQLKTRHPGLVILNPPRQGLTKKVIEMLLKSRVESMIYISCMPSTLARDLQFICREYQIKEGAVYDMFPQTAHVETLIFLKAYSKSSDRRF